MTFLLSELRTCATCSTDKPLKDYRLRTGVKSGKRYEWRERTCAECRRAAHKVWRDANPEKSHAWHRRKVVAQYGLTPEQYDAMVEAQTGLCAVCGQGPGVGCTKTYLAVDHDHHTGKVRGLLCDPCNRAIGCMGNDPERLISAAAYLMGGSA